MPSRDDHSHGRIANFKFNNKHEVSVNQLIYDLDKEFTIAIICFNFTLYI